MEAIHFGADDRLFGVHSPARGPLRRSAVLLCHSWGAEYMRSYRALHLMAEQLAAHGFDTLRFDYSSTGDSQDRENLLCVEHWIEDLQDALAELRELSGAERVCVVGLRLGALLALRGAAGGLRIDHLLLWDLPADGTQWIGQMQALDHAQYARKNRYLPAALQLRARPDELLGLPWPATLGETIGALRAAPALPAECTLLLHSADAGSAIMDFPAQAQIRLPEASNWGDIAWLSTPWSCARAAPILCETLENWL